MAVSIRAVLLESELASLLVVVESGGTERTALFFLCPGAGPEGKTMELRMLEGLGWLKAFMLPEIAEAEAVLCRRAFGSPSAPSDGLCLWVGGVTWG